MVCCISQLKKKRKKLIEIDLNLSSSAFNMIQEKIPIQILLNKFTSSIGLPFQKILPARVIEEILIEEGIKYRNRFFFTDDCHLGIFISSFRC